MNDPDMEKAREISHKWVMSDDPPCGSTFHGHNCNQLTEAIAAAIKAEREACVNAVMNCTEPGEKAPMSHFASAIRARGGE